MSKPLRTEEEAERELEEALRWYEEKRPGLGAEFLSAVDDALTQIRRLPNTGGRVPQVNPDLRVRRIPLKKFPYHVVYLETDDAIRVLAFAHDRRRPGYWLSRYERP